MISTVGSRLVNISQILWVETTPNADPAKPSIDAVFTGGLRLTFFGQEIQELQSQIMMANSRDREIEVRISSFPLGFNMGGQFGGM